MEVLVLGPGCPNCRKTHQLTLEAVEAAGIGAEVKEVTDIAEIAKYVMLTPGVVIDGEVKCAGRVPSLEELTAWLREHAEGQ